MPSPTAKDPFKGWAENNVMAQGRKLVEITPDDDNDLPIIPKALLCTVAGTITIEAVDGNFAADGETTFTGGFPFELAAGDVFDFCQVRRVYETGTDATVVGTI